MCGSIPFKARDHPSRSIALEIDGARDEDILIGSHAIGGGWVDPDRVYLLLELYGLQDGYLQIRVRQGVPRALIGRELASVSVDQLNLGRMFAAWPMIPAAIGSYLAFRAVATVWVIVRRRDLFWHPWRP